MSGEPGRGGRRGKKAECGDEHGGGEQARAAAGGGGDCDDTEDAGVPSTSRDDEADHAGEGGGEVLDVLAVVAVVVVDLAALDVALTLVLVLSVVLFKLFLLFFFPIRASTSFLPALRARSRSSVSGAMNKSTPSSRTVRSSTTRCSSASDTSGPVTLRGLPLPRFDLTTAG